LPVALFIVSFGRFPTILSDFATFHLWQGVRHTTCVIFCEMNLRGISVVTRLSLAFSIMLAGASIASAGSGDIGKAVAGKPAAVDVAGAQTSDQVCDPTADYFLGMEDYGEAIATHRRVLAARPGDALAHYHLGFAYGMTGDREREISEYRQAVRLGLRQWDLYLNLGRALLEDGDPTGATGALQTAVALGPERPEGHFNLGLALERSGMLAAALDELQTSLRLDPRQPDARNMIGLIYAEEHDYTRAREIWIELARTEPDFEPARLNLAILRGAEAFGERSPTDRNTMRAAFAFNRN
jgi:tetratricopeptide (TPR) repeat protein